MTGNVGERDGEGLGNYGSGLWYDTLADRAMVLLKYQQALIRLDTIEREVPIFILLVKEANY